MASDVVVRAEGLGKKYVIGHQSAERSNTLRDAMSRSARNWARSLRDLAKGSANVAGDEIEEFWALKDVSFEIKRGEVVGIIGRNGAGKSTLLKVLSRITEPSEGRVQIKGRIASLLEVGTGFHPELSGRENVYLNGAILGMSREEIRRKFDEIIAFAGIEKFLDTPVKRYSSGMYVRLAFAVAAHLEPEILIVDEVLAVGDAEFQKKCLGKMRDVAGHGRTVLFVSHNLAAVTSLCGSGLVMSGGRIAARGSIASVISEYAALGDNSYFAEFPPRPGEPTITAVRVDETALRQRDLVVQIEFSSPEMLSKAVGGVVLRAPTGEPVWGSNNRFHPMATESQNVVSGVLRCEVKRLPVFDGQYLISVWLGDWERDYDSRLDVLTVNVDGGPRILHRPGQGMVGHLDWPARWQSISQGEQVLV